VGNARINYTTMNDTPNPARAVKEKTEKLCYHCGESCRNEAIYAHEKDFCCDGCRLVYEILNENSLCSYYSIEPASGNTVKSQTEKGHYSYLDEPEISSKLIHFSDGKQSHLTLFVPGIHCSSCIWLLEHLQKLNEGIYNSSVNFPKREVSISYNPEKTKLSEIAALMSSIGYEPHISMQDLESEQITKTDRSSWYKIGIAGFCFGNIMMFSFPEYFSIADTLEEPGLRLAFSYLNLALALPVLLYSSSGFFRSAIGALKARQLNIDLPLSAAILMTFIRSVYEILSRTGPGYLDSMSGIVFFMLIGRAFQNKTYQTLAFDRDYRSYFPVAVSVASAEGERRVTVTSLKRGMRMIIRNGEIIPADSILLRGKASIDYSFVTGEADPVTKNSGDLIFAGGKQTGKRIELEIVKPVKQSYLTTLWNKPAFAKDDAAERRASLENTINTWFTVAVFLIAAVSAIYWYWASEPVKILHVVTTILIVACPCILLLAASFTQGNVLRIMGKYGFFLRNAFTIEKLAAAQVIVFDKTGTLTSPAEPDIHFSGSLSESEKQQVGSICAHSNHPLSRLIAEVLGNTGAREVIDFEEISGKGIKARINNDLFLIGSESLTGEAPQAFNMNSTRVFVSKNGQVLGHFTLKHTLREGVAEMLSALSKKYELYLLSGDHDGDREIMSKWFKSDHMHFQCSPGDKLEFVHKLKQSGKKVMMVGDGLNDAGALRESDAGVAVSDNLNNFSPASDAILNGSLMKGLHKLMRYSKDSGRVIRISFAFSLVYNVAGLYFAVRGELQPVIAAILMPAASISIVSIATTLSTLYSRYRGLKHIKHDENHISC
jgi:Cu+-exporting ATPase